MIKQAKTKYGIYESVPSEEGFALFRGIRYGKAERFCPPEEIEPFEGVKVCDTYGGVSPQPPFNMNDETGRPKIIMPGYPYPPEMSEDCLYLNITTPADSPEDRLPVMFYIHGGAEQTWYGACYEYRGDGLASHGAVVVTINYRLNVFGFMTHPELAAENEHHISGNYGMMDQLLALRWVRENIAGFGGDPDRILIFGQSAGARSVQMFLGMPAAQGLFRRAAMHSGGGMYSFPDATRETLEARGVEFVEFCGVNSVQELKTMPFDELEAFSVRFMRERRRVFQTYADGWLISETPEQAAIAGRFPNTEYILGSTIDEGYSDKPGILSGFAPTMRVFADILREKTGKAPYVYCFNRPQPGDDIGTPHSCDNRYVFCSLRESWRPYTEDDFALSEQMMRYWTNFAATGDPNGEDLPLWEPFDDRRLSLELRADGPRMADLTNEYVVSREEEIREKISHEITA